MSAGMESAGMVNILYPPFKLKRGLYLSLVSLPYGPIIAKETKVNKKEKIRDRLTLISPWARLLSPLHSPPEGL